MKTTLADRLRTARTAKGITQKALGDLIGVSQAAIQKIETGKAAQTTKLYELSAALGVSAAWLSTGEGEMTMESTKIEPVRALDKDYYRVDVFDVQASAGSGVMVRDEFIETIRSIEYSNEEARTLFAGRPAAHIKMIAVNGDSMSGTFEPRDQIFIDVSVDFFDGDGIYIFTLDQSLYIKRLQRQHKRLAVISDNKKYETWYIEDGEIADLRICAKVLVSQSRAYRFHG